MPVAGKKISVELENDVPFQYTFVPRRMETSTRCTPDVASDAVPQMPGLEHPAFHVAVVWLVLLSGKVTVELGFVLS